MTASPPVRVLLICHDMSRMASLAPRLESMGFHCDQMKAQAGSLREDVIGSPDVIVALGTSAGWQPPRHLAADGPPVIVVAESATPSDRAEALASPGSAVWDWVESSCTDRELAARIGRLARVHRLTLEVEELTRRCNAMDTVDRLTGLPNHRAFHECLGKEFRRAERYDSPLALILIDIDKFRAINDVFGHLWGDRVLQDLARRARALLRETDVICRYGGDELALLLPETDAAAAASVAERLRAMVEQAAGDLRERLPAPAPGSHSPFSLAVSLGVTCYPAEGLISRAAMLACAEAALRQDKNQGRDRSASPMAQ